MDYPKYIEKRDGGLQEIKQAGDTLLISTTKFNENTGESYKVEENISVKEIEATIAELQKHIDGLHALLADNKAKVDAVETPII